jgi:hypothetical protein
MANSLFGIDMNKIVDGGWTLSSAWEYYTVNVKYLNTMTHEQFCAEYPEAAQEIERVSKLQDKLKQMLEEK